ncbi:MAG TPA: glycosyltransferase family 4 protein [Planctomycetes bacterium]|nr:glycosyltransferase family 4 protein [Planctomycetota bacterium]HIK60226.1 glycosyltransferase family 4 protein [Planctomycetota bacterium]
MSPAPLRVCVATSLFPSPGHPNRGIFAERRWQALAARGHRIQVVHPQPYVPPLVGGEWGEIRMMPALEVRGALAVSRPRYLHLPGRPVQNAPRFARAAWGQVDAPDVMVCDYAWPAAALAPLCRQEGLPCLINGRGSDVLEVSGEANLGSELGEFLADASGWAAVSQDLVRVMDRLGRSAGASHRGVLIPNGVDHTRFFPQNQSECRRQLKLPQEGRVVLVVGHLIERKDPLLALEAFDRGAPEDARLLFVGAGPLEGAVHGAIQERGLEGRVDCVGEVLPDELAVYYGAADLLLLTSSREGRPNVVLEALACGRPVLATAAGGTAEVLGDSTMLLDGRDPEELGQRIGALLAAPPDEKSLRALVEDLTWERSTDTLETVLHRLARG